MLATALLVWALLLAAWPAAAGLFDTEAALSVRLELPLRQLLRSKTDRTQFPATLSYTEADGRQVALAIEVRIRGKKRVELCDLPPLHLDFKPKLAEGTLFQGQRELKLVTQCKGRARYQDYLLLERKIYQAYNLVTPLSFRTRLLSVTYVDTDGKTREFTEPAFLIEDIGDVAQRLGMQRVHQRQVSPDDMDPASQNLAEVFQFMIGNTDWSALRPSEDDDECCHNGKALAPLDSTTRGIVVLPYDFDHAGLIDADYATVSPVLKTDSVTDRVYRGRCAFTPQVSASLARLREVRPDIERLFEDPGLDPAAARKALSYLRGFYELAASDKQLQRRIYDACLGG